MAQQERQTYPSGRISEGILHRDGQDVAGNVRMPIIQKLTPAGPLPVLLSPLQLA